MQPWPVACRLPGCMLLFTPHLSSPPPASPPPAAELGHSFGSPHTHEVSACMSTCPCGAVMVRLHTHTPSPSRPAHAPSTEARPAPCPAHLPQFCNILGNPNTIGEPALQGGCGWFHAHHHSSPGWLGAHPPLVPHLPAAAHLARLLSHPAQRQMTASSRRAIGSKESTRPSARSPAVSESCPTAPPSPLHPAVGWGRS